VVGKGLKNYFYIVKCLVLFIFDGHFCLNQVQPDSDNTIYAEMLLCTGHTLEICNLQINNKIVCVCYSG